jgi:hypothetical protein
MDAGKDNAMSSDDEATGAPVVRRRVILTGINSRAWEHPADRGALAALRELRGFDEVLKALSGLWNERALRLWSTSAVRSGSTIGSTRGSTGCSPRRPPPST